MDRSRHWANRPQVPDFVRFITSPKSASPEVFARLYVKNGLSASQVAAETGLCRSAVLGRLHKLGIRNVKDRGCSLDNFCFPQRVPFGQKIVQGRLIENRREMKTVRQILEMRERQKLSWNCIAQALNRGDFKTRHGQPWKIGTVIKVFVRWAGKV